MTGFVQIGLGGWGRDWATQVLPEVPGVEVLGCVDANPDALEAACHLGVVDEGHCFASLGAALDAVEVAAVLVTTDLPSHVPAVETALRLGKHVLVEKPFAPTVVEAQQLVELADELGRVLMVSQNYRFFPAVRAAQRVTASGELGQLLHIDLDFRRFSALPKLPASRGHRAWAEPLLLDMSIHHFDLLRAVTGVEPAAIECRTWNPRWAGFDDPPEGVATIELADGTTVSYRGSWVCPDHLTAWSGEWRMEFEHGELWWTSHADPPSTSTDEAWRYDHRAARVAEPLPAVRFLDRAGAIEEFVRAVDDGREPESSGRQNLGSLALTHAAIESARLQRVVLPSTLSESTRPGAPAIA